MKQTKHISERVKGAVLLGLIAVISIGGIRAYMTDRETADNQFTVGKVDFNLYEEAWDGEQPDGTYATPSDATPSNALGEDQAQNIYAGQVIDKNPAIKNNSKNDAYLRMRVKIPVAKVVTADKDGNVLNGGQAVETELFTYEENEGTGMRKISDHPEIATSSDASRVYHVYEYQYTGDGDQEIPLPAGQDIPALFDTVTFANVIEGQVDEELEIISVDFQAIQSGGFASPEEAWAAYKNQNPE